MGQVPVLSHVVGQGRSQCFLINTVSKHVSTVPYEDRHIERATPCESRDREWHETLQITGATRGYGAQS